MLQRVSQDIATGVGDAYKVMGTYKTMQVCAVVKHENLFFKTKFEEENIWT